MDSWIFTLYFALYSKSLCVSVSLSLSLSIYLTLFQLWPLGTLSLYLLGLLTDPHIYILLAFPWFFLAQDATRSHGIIHEPVLESTIS